MLVVMVMAGLFLGAMAIASAYDEAEGCETLGDLVARLAGEMVR